MKAAFVVAAIKTPRNLVILPGFPSNNNQARKIERSKISRTERLAPLAHWSQLLKPTSDLALVLAVRFPEQFRQRLLFRFDLQPVHEPDKNRDDQKR